MRDEMASVAVVGVGSIGGSWVALALARGLTVHASDPAPGAEQRLRAIVRDHLGVLVDGDPEEALDRLSFAADLAAAVVDADLVLEAGPERVDVKRELFAALDAATDPAALPASSSPGFGPGAFQDACRHPERVVVTPPFTPPHLVPLVEVVAGRHTSEAAVEAAM